jgi:hypothetical protein
MFGDSDEFVVVEIDGSMPKEIIKNTQQGD